MLKGYQPMIFKKREEKRGGGVGIFVRDGVEFEILPDLSIFQEDKYESLFIKVFDKKGKFKIIGNIYRPPNNSLDLFLEIFGAVLDKLGSHNNYKNAEEILLTGDFNINLLKHLEHNQTNNFLTMLLSHSFLPTITLPSRVNDTSATCIDNIFSNKQNINFNSGLVIEHISDHLPIFLIDTKSKLDINISPPKIVRNMSKNNINNFKTNLSYVNWDRVLNNDNPEQAFDSFSNITNEKFDESFPYMTIKKNRKKVPQNPWMSHELLLVRRKKDRLFKDRVKSPTDDNKRKWREINGIYQNKVRKAKKEYYNAKFLEFSNDIKKTWSMINSLINKRKHKESLPGVFFDEIKSYENVKSIAEGFNNFFTNIGAKIADNIPNSDSNFNEYLGEEIQNTFSFKVISKETILEALSKLKPKKSSGEDNISMFLLKEISNEIINPLIHLFNLSFKTGFIPQNYKCAKVVPIYKAGEKNRFNNYRPISLLSAFSKVLEKIVAIQMLKFLDQNKILYSHQYGFRPGHDTTQPLLNLLKKIYDNLNKATSESRAYKGFFLGGVQLFWGGIWPARFF